MIKKVTLIGSGNVAHNLGHELRNQGIEIVEVYSRTIKNAKKLAIQLDSDFTNSLKNLNKKSDLYLLASKDDAMEEIVAQLDLEGKLIAHTSGSVSISVLKKATTNYGSFYPLQTFTKSHLTDFTSVPFCIEGSNTKSLKSLLQLANKSSDKVIKMSSEQRQKMHLSAVFASNFANYMQVIAQDICEEQEVDFELLRPLIKEVFEKNKTDKAENNQTGPAKRGDEFTLKKHMELLENDKEKQELYALISSCIKSRFSQNK